MSTDSKATLLSVLEEAGIPIVAMGAVVALAVGLRDASDKVGWRVLAVVACATCLAWAVYVWTARKPHAIVPGELVRRFPRRARLGAIIAAVIAALPVLFLSFVRYPYPDIPFLIVKVVNKTPKALTVAEYAESHFTVPGGPMTEDVIATGRLKFQPINSSHTFVAPPNGEVWVAGRFLNEKALAPLLNSTLSR